IVLPKGGVYITRDGLLHIAHRSGQLDGIVVEQEPTLSDDGREWVARVSVYRRDMRHPFTFPGRYPVNGGNAAYAQEMAMKAAEAHALRRAFDVTGLPTLDDQRPEQPSRRVTAADIAPQQPAQPEPVDGEVYDPDADAAEQAAAAAHPGGESGARRWRCAPPQDCRALGRRPSRTRCGSRPGCPTSTPSLSLTCWTMSPAWSTAAPTWPARMWTGSRAATWPAASSITPSPWPARSSGGRRESDHPVPVPPRWPPHRRRRTPGPRRAGRPSAARRRRRSGPPPRGAGRRRGPREGVRRRGRRAHHVHPV